MTLSPSGRRLLMVIALVVLSAEPLLHTIRLARRAAS